MHRWLLGVLPPEHHALIHQVTASVGLVAASTAAKAWCGAQSLM